MKRSVSVLLIIVSVVVTLVVAATAALGVMTYLKVSAIEAQTVEEIPEGGNEGEDNIEIAGEYWIRSTKEISDAYLAGDSSTLSEKDKETYDMAAEILDSIITDDMGEYEKEKAVFEWMNKNIGEDADVTVLVRDDTSTDNPHGVLTGREAVCVGYATTFRLFMQMLDIPCMVVHNTSLVHSWDLAQIAGHWYHVDLYSANHCQDPLQYLNRSDSVMLALGNEWDTRFYPAADSVEKSYIYMNSKEAQDVYAVPDEVKKALDNNENLVALTVSGGENERNLAQRMVDSVSEKLANSEEYSNYGITGCATVEDDKVFIYISIEDYNEEEDDYDDGLTDEEVQQIDDAINDTFGDLTEISYVY